MRTFKIIFLLIIFSPNLLAVNLEECSNQGREYLGQLGSMFIDPMCESLTYEETNITKRFSTKDKSIEGHGHKNLIYFKKKNLSIDPPVPVSYTHLTLPTICSV